MLVLRTSTPDDALDVTVQRFLRRAAWRSRDDEGDWAQHNGSRRVESHAILNGAGPAPVAEVQAALTAELRV